MKTDYSDLVGEEIKIIIVGGKRPGMARVVGADYHIGITIEYVNLPGHYVMCLNGPLSPVVIRNKISFTRGIWRKLFHGTIKRIQSGTIDMTEFRCFVSSLYETDIFLPPSHDSCAFNQ